QLGQMTYARAISVGVCGRLGDRGRKSWPRVLSPEGRGGTGALRRYCMGPFKDIGVDLKDMVATIEIRRPPHNFFDIDLIRQVADACEALDKDSGCRAIVLASQGTAFCAGAKLGEGSDVQDVLVKRSETGQ